MSSSQQKNFLPETVTLLTSVINMTLNKAEQLSRRNQLSVGKPMPYENFKVIDDNKASSENVSVLKSKLPRNNSSASQQFVNNSFEAQPLIGHAVGVDLLSTDITAGRADKIFREPIKIEIPKECPSTSFSYMMKVRKDAEDIHIPAKIVVTHLHQTGVDINFHMDTKIHPELPSLYIRIVCPNYEPKQVWINGKEYIH